MNRKKIDILLLLIFSFKSALDIALSIYCISKGLTSQAGMWLIAFIITATSIVVGTKVVLEEIK